jgi:transposase
MNAQTIGIDTAKRIFFLHGESALGKVTLRQKLTRERLIPFLALGRSNWLFAGSLRAGQRAANIMSLIQSAKLNGHDPYHYLKDVLERLPTQPAGRLEELLPHRWQAIEASH